MARLEKGTAQSHYRLITLSFAAAFGTLLVIQNPASFGFEHAPHTPITRRRTPAPKKGSSHPMNQYEAVLAAARQAVVDQTVATSRARNDREQAFLQEMEPVLRAEARRRGRNSRKEEWFDEEDWGTPESA